jgi:hypothetical protein
MPEPVPSGISPILRASWKFARSVAQQFNRELMKDRVNVFLKKLSDKFV